MGTRSFLLLAGTVLTLCCVVWAVQDNNASEFQFSPDTFETRRVQTVFNIPVGKADDDPPTRPRIFHFLIEEGYFTPAAEPKRWHTVIRYNPDYHRRGVY